MQRNTAPSVAWAIHRILRLDEEASVAITPADQIILNEAAFKDCILEKLEFTAQNDVLMPLGISPTRPEPGYGYIQMGEATSYADIYKVKAFTEKPDREFAQLFMESGEFYWNTGMFLANARHSLECFCKILPVVIRDFDSRDANGNYDWTKSAGQQYFMQQAKKYGVDHFLLFSNSAPVQFTKNGKACANKGVSGSNLADNHYADFAKFLTTTTKHFTDFTVKLIGNNTVTADLASMVLNQTSTITGDGSLHLTSKRFCGLDMESASVTIDNTSLFVKGGYGIAGFIGAKSEVLTVRNSYVEAEGTGSGSITLISDLILDNCAITQPVGAEFDADQKAVVLNGELLKSKVVIEPITNSIGTVTADVPARKQGIYNLNGVKLTQQWNDLPAGIYIVDGVKRVKN